MKEKRFFVSHTASIGVLYDNHQVFYAMGSWPKCRTQNDWDGPHSENGSAKLSKTSVAEGLFFSNVCTDTFNISFICYKNNKDFNTLWNLCLIIINLMKF